MAGAADPFLAQRGQPTRCGIDSVEIARIERLLRETPAEDLIRYFLAAGARRQRRRAGPGGKPGGALCRQGGLRQALSARARTRPRSSPPIFRSSAMPTARRRSSAAPGAELVLGRQRIAGDRSIADARSDKRIRGRAGAAGASRGTAGRPAPLSPAAVAPRVSSWKICAACSARRSPKPRSSRLAQAHYAHLWRLAGEFLRFRWLSEERKSALIRVDNVEALARALERGKGVLILTGHFGNFEVATIAGLRHFPQMRGRFHFVRRAIQAALARRAGEPAVPAGGLRRAGQARIARCDPRAPRGGRPGRVSVRPARARRPTASRSTSSAIRRGRSRASRSSRSRPARRCVPASSWREPDGSHVLRFEEALPPIECDKRQRGNPAQHPCLQRDARKSWCCATPSSGSGCTGAGSSRRRPRAPRGPGRSGAIMAATTEDRR